MTNNEKLKTFEEYLVTDGKGTKTILSYTGDIKGFLEWLGTKNVNFIGSLTRFYITSYKEYLIRKGTGYRPTFVETCTEGSHR